MFKTLTPKNILVSISAIIALTAFTSVSADQTLASNSARQTPIIEMVRYSSKLENPDLTPNLRIYGDGLVEIYRPVYFKNSGLFRAQLSEAQLTDLIDASALLQDFDPVVSEQSYTRSELQRSNQTGELFYVSEQVVTQLTLRTGLRKEAVSTIVAENAQLKASRFPQLQSWQTFAGVEQQLLNLESQLSLEKISDAKPYF